MMSFPLLLPLWRDVSVRRREEKGRRSGWVVGGPQLHTSPPWSPAPAGRGWRAREQMAFCGSGSGLLKSPHHLPGPQAPPRGAGCPGVLFGGGLGKLSENKIFFTLPTGFRKCLRRPSNQHPYPQYSLSPGFGPLGVSLSSVDSGDAMTPLASQDSAPKEDTGCGHQRLVNGTHHPPSRPSQKPASHVQLPVLHPHPQWAALLHISTICPRPPA